MLSVMLIEDIDYGIQGSIQDHFKNEKVLPYPILHDGRRVVPVISNKSINYYLIRGVFNICRIYNEDNRDVRPSGIHYSTKHEDFIPLGDFLKEQYPEYFL